MEEFPTGVSSGSEGDEPDEEEDKRDRDSDDDWFAEEPVDKYGRPVDPCPDLVRLDPEVK